MERFRLRIRQEKKRGQIIELHLFPQKPQQPPREKDAVIMGSTSSAETLRWLRELSEPYLGRAETPGPISVDQFVPGCQPRWLRHEDGLRLALAFVSARWLRGAKQKTKFREGLADLPSEVVLYWFTLCFYGYRQAAGRAALRMLLTYGEAESGKSTRSRTKSEKAANGTTTGETMGSRRRHTATAATGT